MLKTFYLASHDYVDSPEPRLCSLLYFVNQSSRENDLMVEVDKPLPFPGDGGESTSQILLAFCDPKQTIDDVGRTTIMVDIFLPKANFPGGEQPGHLLRIGVGTLHPNYKEALEHSPID
jgi:hypothetical protein